MLHTSCFLHSPLIFEINFFFMLFKDLILLIHIPCLESSMGKGVAEILRSWLSWNTEGVWISLKSIEAKDRGHCFFSSKKDVEGLLVLSLWNALRLNVCHCSHSLRSFKGQECFKGARATARYYKKPSRSLPKSYNFTQWENYQQKTLLYYNSLNTLQNYLSV